MTRTRRRTLGHARTALDLVTRFGVPPALALAILRTSPGAGAVTAEAALLASYVAYVMLVGRWTPRATLLVPMACLAAIPIGLARPGDAGPQDGAAGMAALAGCLAVFFLVRAWAALRARADLPGPAIALGPPLGPGRYLVAQGGSRRILNAHLACRGVPHLQGQSFGVDIVGLSRTGLTARPFRSADPAGHAIFGRTVLAPVDATVIHVADGRADLSPPETDRDRPMGNHIWLEAESPQGPIAILLAHLRAGSITVAAGATIRQGARVGEVGNSGNTSEPHLHIHVQARHDPADPLAADPLPMRFAGLGQLHRGRRFHLD